MPDSVHMLVWFWVLLLWGLVFGIFCQLVVLFFFLFSIFFSPVSFWVFLKKKMGLSSALCLYSLPCSLVWRAAGCKPEMYDYPNGGLISMSGECEDIEGRKKKLEVELRLHNFPWGYSGRKGQFCLCRLQKFLPFTALCYVLHSTCRLCISFTTSHCSYCAEAAFNNALTK